MADRSIQYPLSCIRPGWRPMLRLLHSRDDGLHHRIRRILRASLRRIRLDDPSVRRQSHDKHVRDRDADQSRLHGHLVRRSSRNANHWRAADEHRGLCSARMLRGRCCPAWCGNRPCRQADPGKADGNMESMMAVECAHSCECCCILQGLEIFKHISAASEPC